MDITILIAAFMGSSLWAMLGPIPFLRIDPTHTLRERLVGSLQLTGVVFVLQEIHPYIFPDEDWSTWYPPSIEASPETPLTSLNITMESPPEATTEMRPQAGLQPVWQKPAVPRWNGKYIFSSLVSFGLLFTVLIVVQATLRFLLRCLKGNKDVAQRKDRQSVASESTVSLLPADHVVVDKILFGRLVETLTNVFHDNHFDQSHGVQSKASNVVAVLDLIKASVPLAADHGGSFPKYDALLCFWEGLAKMETAINLIFPPFEIPKASGLGGDAGASLHAPDETSFAQYKEEFDRNIDAASEDQNNITPIDEIRKPRDDNATRELLNKGLRNLQGRITQLHGAIARPTEANSGRESSGGRKVGVSQADGKANGISTALQTLQAEFDRLDRELLTVSSRLKEITEPHKYRLSQVNPALADTISSLGAELKNIKQVQEDLRCKTSASLKKMDLKTAELVRALKHFPADLESLTTLSREFETNDPLLQRLVKKLGIFNKWACEISLFVRGNSQRIVELQNESKSACTRYAFLEAENSKLWEAFAGMTPWGLYDTMLDGDSQTFQGNQEIQQVSSESTIHVGPQAKEEADKDASTTKTLNIFDNGTLTDTGSQGAKTEKPGSFEDGKASFHDSEVDQLLQVSEQLSISVDTSLLSITSGTLDSLENGHVVDDETNGALEQEATQPIPEKSDDDSMADQPSEQMHRHPNTTHPESNLIMDSIPAAREKEGAVNEGISVALEQGAAQDGSQRGACGLGAGPGNTASAHEFNYRTISIMLEQAEGKEKLLSISKGREDTRAAQGHREMIQAQEMTEQGELDFSVPVPALRSHSVHTRQDEAGSAETSGSTLEGIVTGVKAAGDSKLAMTPAHHPSFQTPASSVDEGAVSSSQEQHGSVDEPQGQSKDKRSFAAERPRLRPPSRLPMPHGYKHFVAKARSPVSVQSGVALQQTARNQVQAYEQADILSGERPIVPPAAKVLAYETYGYGGPKAKAIRSFPPAGTKIDYQPPTSRTSSFNERSGDGQSKGEDTETGQLGRTFSSQNLEIAAAQQKLQEEGSYSSAPLYDGYVEGKVARSNSDLTSTFRPERLTREEERKPLDDSSPSGYEHHRSEPPRGSII